MVTRLVRDLGRGDELDAALADLEELKPGFPQDPSERAYAGRAGAHARSSQRELAVAWVRPDHRGSGAMGRQAGSARSRWSRRGRPSPAGSAIATRRWRRSVRPSPRPRRWEIAVVCAGLHNMLSVSRCTPGRGKRSFGRSTAAAERRLRHDDPHEARGPSGRDHGDQRRRHAARASSRLDSWVRPFGEVTPKRGAMARPQPGVDLAGRRAHGGGSGASRHEGSTWTSSDHPWELTGSRCISPEHAATAVEPLLRRLGDVGMAKLFSPNVEWTVLPVDAGPPCRVVAPAVVRDVLGPDAGTRAWKPPWCPLGEAMVIAAEGDHLKALEQLDLVLPSRTRPFGDAAASSPRTTSADTTRWTVERGRLEALGELRERQPCGSSSSARRICAARAITWTPPFAADPVRSDESSGRAIHRTLASRQTGQPSRPRTRPDPAREPRNGPP